VSQPLLSYPDLDFVLETRPRQPDNTIREASPSPATAVPPSAPEDKELAKTQLRRYEIEDGQMETFLVHWHKLIEQRQKFGFRVVFAQDSASYLLA
jgi:hypothetical protein